jgi:hypothetical protein
MSDRIVKNVDLVLGGVDKTGPAIDSATARIKKYAAEAQRTKAQIYDRVTTDSIERQVQDRLAAQQKRAVAGMERARVDQAVAIRNAFDEGPSNDPSAPYRARRAGPAGMTDSEAAEKRKRIDEHAARFSEADEIRRSEGEAKRKRIDESASEQQSAWDRDTEAFKKFRSERQNLRDGQAAQARIWRKNDREEMLRDMQRGVPGAAGQEGYGGGFENRKDLLPPKSGGGKDAFEKFKEWNVTQVFIANRINRMVGEIGTAIGKLGQDLHDPEKSTTEIVRNFAEGLPLIGGWVNAGTEIREIFTREAEEIAVIKKGAEEINDALKVRANLEKEIRKNADERADAEDRIRVRMAGAGLTGQPEEDAKRAAQHKATLDEMERQQEARKKEAFSPDSGMNKEIQKVRDDLSAERKSQKAAEDEAFNLSSLGTGKAKSTRQLAAENIAASHKEAADALQQKLTGKNGLESIRDAELKRIEADAGKTTEESKAQATEDAVIKERRAHDEKWRIIDEDNAREKRTAEASETTDEARLRNQGEYLEADMRQIEAHGKAREREIGNQYGKELDYRKRTLGETDARARAFLAPGRQKDLDANQAEVDAKKSEKREQDRREIDREAFSHSQELSGTRANIVEARLRAAGQEDAAEKIALTADHERKLDAIKERAKTEKEQHAERSKIDAQAEESAGAENESFAATLEEQRIRNIRRSAPAAFASGGPLGGAATGDLSQGFADSRANAGEGLQKELNALTKKTHVLLQSLIATLGKSGVKLLTMPNTP